MHWTEFFTSGASLFIVATASTKTMVPLRVLAIVANCFLITVFAVSHSWFPMALQALALPMNGYRLHQMIVLIRNVREAIRGKPSLDWLKPFMTERHFSKGDVLFAKGEPADEMFCAVTGRYVSPSWASRSNPARCSASWRCWRPTIGARRRWNASRTAKSCRSPTSKSSSSIIRIRHSASISCGWRRRGCSTISAGWKPN